MGRTGLYTQLGIAEEPSYGTYQAPARFLPIVSEGLEDEYDRIVSQALMAGKKYDDYWAENRKGATGPVVFEVFNKGFGLVLKHMTGAIASSQPAVGTDPTVWEHLATPGDIDGKSLTWQVGLPDVGGTINPLTLLGGKITEWEITLEVDGLLRLQVTINGMKFSTAQSLATASYATGLKPIPFHGATLDIGAVTLKVRSFTISGSSGLKIDRFMLGSMDKLEPIQDTERRSAEVELPGDFDPATGAGMAAYNRFVNGTEAAFNCKALGDVISGTYKYGLEISCPRVRTDGATPTVGGPDLLEQTQHLKALTPATGSAISLLYRSTDVTP